MKRKMKRIVICLFITAVLIIMGAASLCYTDSVTREAADTIDSVAASFEQGDFAQAKSLTMRLSQNWENFIENHPFLIDEEHIMEITVSIARIKSLAEEESEDLPEECAVTRELVQLYREKNSVNLKNIF